MNSQEPPFGLERVCVNGGGEEGKHSRPHHPDQGSSAFVSYLVILNKDLINKKSAFFF